MKKKLIILFCLLIFFSAYLYTRNKCFIVPNEIILYKNGDAQTINKDNKVFSEIVKEMNNRAHHHFNVAKLAFNRNDMVELKKREIIIEFKYSKKHISYIRLYGEEYSSLIFPLTGLYKELVFFDNSNENLNGPLGPLDSPDILLNLLNKQ